MRYRDRTLPSPHSCHRCRSSVSQWFLRLGARYDLEHWTSPGEHPWEKASKRAQTGSNSQSLAEQVQNTKNKNIYCHTCSCPCVCRWSLLFWGTTQSWGPSTASTADWVPPGRQTTSSCCRVCSCGVCWKTVTSTMTSLWQRSTV